MSKKGDFFRTILELEQRGYLWKPRRLASNVYECTAPAGWTIAAKESAAMLGGVIRPVAAGGFGWYYGAGPAKGTVLTPPQVTKLMSARKTALPLIGDAVSGYWSVGRIARALFAFVGEPMEYQLSVERFLLEHPYGYHECYPGLYTAKKGEYIGQKDLFAPEVYGEDSYTPAVSLWDVQGYYYHMFRRLKSLRLSVDRAGVLDFFPMFPNDAARWRDVLDVVAPDKPLRNSLAGVSAGTKKARIGYTSTPPKTEAEAKTWDGHTREVWMPGIPGPFRAAGLLLVATGAELCYREALTSNAIYATIDSVVVKGLYRPTVWKSAGFAVEVKTRGDAEICHRGSWRIGKTHTRNWANHDREPETTERRYVPQTFTNQWL